MKQMLQQGVHRLVSLLVALGMALAMALPGAAPVLAEGVYTVEVTASAAAVTAGDTVTLTARVYQDGKEITDLAAEGLYLWWWTDVWAEGHTDGWEDAAYSNYDNNSGHSLTADVTVPSEGTYYIAAELQDSGYSRISVQFVEITVTAAAKVPEPVEGLLDIDYIPGLPDDFAMGVDISSVVSELNSGVTFRDWEGNPIDNIADFCKLLRASGVTHVRVRVWNDPFDADGNGYGGGNNDVDAAVKIAEGCAAAGLKLLVDFHCSDFWADPSKQQAPKAWVGYTLEEKEKAVADFITDALTRISATGADIDMVQVGNETTGGFAGESGVANMCALFSAGSAAVSTFDPAIRVVIHVTNPEKSTMTTWAKNLQTYGVAYDILATSYYPYWHGTLDNLKSQIQAVRETYGKQAMVAETSYAFTLDDTDGHDNTVRAGTNDTGSDLLWPFSVQGQATALRDIMAAVHEAGGIGLFYWEPAWITVGDTTGLTGDAYDAQVARNSDLWEEYGSGWASSYAAEYDPGDAGKWFGGSAVDNQALFYADGTPTAALNVWNYVRTGAVSKLVSVDAIQSPALTLDAGGELVLPAAVTVTYNKGAVEEPVEWNAADAAAVDTQTPGVYTVNGIVTFSKAVDDGTYAGRTAAPVSCTVTVKAPNLITDPDDAGFEKGDNFAVSGSGVNLPAEDDPKEGYFSMHWWSTAATTGLVTYTVPITLKPGVYVFEAAAQGLAGDTVTLRILNGAGDTLAEGEPCALTGWKDWQTPSVGLTLTEETAVTLQIAVAMQDGGWGTADCLYLYRTGDAAPDATPAPTATPAPVDPAPADTPAGDAAPAATAAPAPAAVASPQTADDSQPAVWAVVAMAAALGFGAALYARRRKEEI